MQTLKESIKQAGKVNHPWSSMPINFHTNGWRIEGGQDLNTVMLDGYWVWIFEDKDKEGQYTGFVARHKDNKVSKPIKCDAYTSIPDEERFWVKSGKLPTVKNRILRLIEQNKLYQ